MKIRLETEPSPPFKEGEWSRWCGYNGNEWLHCRRAASFNECLSLLRLVVWKPVHWRAWKWQDGSWMPRLRGRKDSFFNQEGKCGFTMKLSSALIEIEDQKTPDKLVTKNKSDLLNWVRNQTATTGQTAAYKDRNKENLYLRGNSVLSLYLSWLTSWADWCQVEKLGFTRRKSCSTECRVFKIPRN